MSSLMNAIFSGRKEQVMSVSLILVTARRTTAKRESVIQRLVPISTVTSMTFEFELEIRACGAKLERIECRPKKIHNQQQSGFGRLVEAPERSVLGITKLWPTTLLMSSTGTLIVCALFVSRANRQSTVSSQIHTVSRGNKKPAINLLCQQHLRSLGRPTDSICIPERSIHATSAWPETKLLANLSPPRHS